MADEETKEALHRIADALERLSPVPQSSADIAGSPAFHWDGSSVQAIEDFAPIALDMLTGIDDQKARLLENSERLANGFAAHDVLLWGSRGMGKSALAKSVVRALQSTEADVAIVEADADKLASLPDLFVVLGKVDRPFIVFIDDIGFDEGNAAPRLLRSMLEGGVAARPSNVRLYVTSNRRHIVPRQMAEQDDPVNPRDVVDDKLALSDRFGLRLGFHAASQDDYLAMIERYAAVYGLDYANEDALLWAKQRGSRSGRVAWQYIVELAGRTGKSLD
ncbi:ATP-binding protein [Parasphingorhabdus cellanae]|uniref:ATP-binding protein n=1 Tax=Parasphingorhabdus cellanae TaxID=2806553 RepID=A0ABX7T3A5_9SPHN|nr:ATP-binding protein [Parasphingorhabdus cellanae]QTD55004.1 ATP-binding protein [Parasphingorhabdus cellanae]